MNTKIESSDLSELLRNKPSKSSQPLHPERADDQKNERLTKSDSFDKNKKKPGRKPTNNVSVTFRCSKDNIDKIEKKIQRVNSKGLALSQREAISLATSLIAHFSFSEFQEFVLKERSRVYTDE